MDKILRTAGRAIVGALLVLFAGSALADTVGAGLNPGTPGTQSSMAGAVYRSTPPTMANGQQVGLGVDSSGNLLVIATSAPLPSGAATAAKQPALGTAGTSSADYISVQGGAGMSPIQIGGLTATAVAAASNPIPAAMYSSAGQSAAFSGTNSDTGSVTTSSAAMNVNAWGRLFNGTTGSRHYQGATALNAWTGVQATAGMAECDDVTPVSSAEGLPVNLRASCTNHALITRPYETAANSWSYAAAASGISNTTTAVTIKASAGGALKNCITGVTISGDALGAATELAIRDGAGGTVLWRIKLGTAALGASAKNWASPICGTAATLLEVVTLTASLTGSVYVDAEGFVAP